MSNHLNFSRGQQIFVVGIDTEYRVSVKQAQFDRAYDDLVCTGIGTYKPSRSFSTREEADAEAQRIVKDRGECRLA